MSYAVIDADGHIAETHRGWIPARFLPPEWQDKAPKFLGVDEAGKERYLIEGVVRPREDRRGMAVQRDPRTATNTVPREQREIGMRDPHKRMPDMDAEGIDVSVLFGDRTGFGVSGLEDPAVAAAYARAYNDWAAFYCKPSPDRLYAVAALPLQEPEVAAGELWRAVKELGHVGGGAPPNVRGKGWDPPDFGPVLDICQSLDVPLCVHHGVGHGNLGIQTAGSERFTTYYHVHIIAHPFEQMLAFASIVCGGVLDRYPTLRVAHLEAGIGWLPYWVERLSGHYEMLRQQVAAKEAPRAYLKAGRVYFSFDADEETLPLAIEVAGEDHVLFATDYWHFDAKWPEVLRIFKARKDVPERVKKKILWDNPSRFYKIGRNGKRK